MCGIAGKLIFDRSGRVTDAEIDGMLGPMRHRGPDGHGIHLDGNVALGHLRLSIIDLSTGAQPLANEDQTVWIAFNGEIYNFEALREKLIARGHSFRTRSDTEVIVHLYEEYGAKCLEHLQGMFAFAIWDRKRSSLLLARDRVGIKPLYYFRSARCLAFASELKSLLTLPEAPRDLDPNAINAFWCLNYLPGSLTMFRGIHKLAPGEFLVADSDGQVATSTYWDLAFSDRGPRSLDDAATELSTLLRRTVREHMIADVPVGVLLSGGMDSSAVLTYAAQETSKPISTFTIGFAGAGVVDERPYARLMARSVRSHHHEATLSANDFWNYLPSLFWHLDEPVCEPPAVALHFVSKLARQHVKVLLSGEGGDEAFGGYPNYPNQLRLQLARRALGPLAQWLAPPASRLASALSMRKVAAYLHQLPRQARQYYWSRVGSPLRSSPSSPFASTAQFQPEFRRQVDPGPLEREMLALFDRVEDQPLLNQLLYVDTKTWLPDDLLVKADKVTMANSLELRVPFLDHKVLEFAAGLPVDLKVRGRQTKRVLRAAFQKVLPPEVLQRKKAGFPVPYGRWLAADLWNQTRDLLLHKDSFTRRYFAPSSVAALMDHHRQHGGAERELFSLLALEFWHRAFLAPVSQPTASLHSLPLTPAPAALTRP